MRGTPVGSVDAHVPAASRPAGLDVAYGGAFAGRHAACPRRGTRSSDGARGRRGGPSATAAVAGITRSSSSAAVGDRGKDRTGRTAVGRHQKGCWASVASHGIPCGSPLAYGHVPLEPRGPGRGVDNAVLYRRSASSSGHATSVRCGAAASRSSHRHVEGEDARGRGPNGARPYGHLDDRVLRPSEIGSDEQENDDRKNRYFRHVRGMLF